MGAFTFTFPDLLLACWDPGLSPVIFGKVQLVPQHRGRDPPNEEAKSFFSHTAGWGGRSYW